MFFGEEQLLVEGFEDDHRSKKTIGVRIFNPIWKSTSNKTAVFVSGMG